MFHTSKSVGNENFYFCCHVPYTQKRNENANCSFRFHLPCKQKRINTHKLLFAFSCSVHTKTYRKSKHLKSVFTVEDLKTLTSCKWMSLGERAKTQNFLEAYYSRNLFFTFFFTIHKNTLRRCKLLKAVPRVEFSINAIKPLKGKLLQKNPF